MLISCRQFRRAHWHRWLAAFAAAVVIGLSVLAASPAMHRWLHEETTDSDDACAVVLFAGGVALPMAGALAIRCFAGRTIRQFLARAVLFLAPRYLLMPERGPPAVG